MGFFNMHYDKPGPGVSVDAPRKKGVARIFELLGRDFFAYFRAGLLAFAGAVPFMLLIGLANTTHALLFVPVAGIVGGAVAMPQLCGMADTILRSLRDEPGYWWHTYCRSWKRNLKATLLPGAICGFVIATQIFTLFHLTALQVSLAFYILSFLGLICTLGLLPYLLAQLALVELSPGALLKNSVLLFMGYLPRTFGAAVVGLVYWGAVLLLFPYSFVPFVLTNFWVPMLLTLFIEYPPLEKSFDIEKSIEAIHEKQLSDDKPSESPDASESEDVEKSDESAN